MKFRLDPSAKAPSKNFMKVPPEIKSRVHLQYFLRALQGEVPEALEDLRECVYPRLAKMVQTLGENVVSEMTAAHFHKYPEAKEYYSAVRGWLEKWNLVPEREEHLLMMRILLTCRRWISNKEAREGLEIADVPMSPFAHAYKYTLPKVVSQPKYREGEAEKEYLERAKKYWKTSYARAHPDSLACMEMAREEGRLEVKPFRGKENKDYYRWAAYYQCKQGATLRGAQEHFDTEQNPDDEFTNQDTFYRAVIRTLGECGLEAREGQRGARAP